MAQLNANRACSPISSEDEHILEMAQHDHDTAINHHKQPRQPVPPEFIADVQETMDPVRLAWRNLSVKVRRGRGIGDGEGELILDNLTGYAEPGRLMAIMGPSGSGKSTLLDALAGRLAKNTIQRGDIWLNGHKLAKASAGVAAYVTQENTGLLGTLTVRETISYSARLRLPDNLSNAEKRGIVEKTIQEMGLQHCTDKTIGNWHLRGVSGGEKKRLSIALEILVQPRLIFFDEPTSGLDSASAFFVMCKLKKLAKEGQTIIASIHQPSSETFELLDDLLLLRKGESLYFGEASRAQQCFAAAGFPCPILRNPSDHFLRAINSDFDETKDTLKELFYDVEEKLSLVEDPLSNKSTAEVVERLREAYHNSEIVMDVNKKVEKIIQQKGTIAAEGSKKMHASLPMQLYVLTVRSFVNMGRDMGYYWLRVAVYLMVAVCLGTIYLNVGTKYESISARASCMFFAAAFLTFMAVGGFPSFTEDMKVFHYERLNGHYGALTFIISNTLSSIPFLILITMVTSLTMYFMVDLHHGADRFFYFASSLFASLLVVECLMKAIASVIPNFLMGIILGAGIMGVYMLVSGFFRVSTHLPKPVWRYPMSYISFHTYTIQGMYENDFLGLEFRNQDPSLPNLQGEMILRDIYGVNLGRSKIVNLVILFCMSLAYILIFLVMIKARDNVQMRGLIRR